MPFIFIFAITAMSLFFQSPPDVTAADHRLSEACKKAIDAIASSREKIGDFRLVVTTVGSTHDQPKLVYRRGDRWRIEFYKMPGTFWDQVYRIDTDDWGEWVDDQLQNHRPTRLMISNGSSVYVGDQKKTANDDVIECELSKGTSPRDLMFNRGRGIPSQVRFAQQLYTDPTPSPSDDFEFDPNPKDAPGLAVFKVSFEHANMTVGHYWHYVDPSKGYCVVKYKSFSLEPGMTLDELTVPDHFLEMKDFHKSPQGWWYPTVVEESQPAAAAREVSTIRYHFEFGKEMLDSLFIVD